LNKQNSLLQLPKLVSGYQTWWYLPKVALWLGSQINFKSS
jgi:hypothetical protein